MTSRVTVSTPGLTFPICRATCANASPRPLRSRDRRIGRGTLRLAPGSFPPALSSPTPVAASSATRAAASSESGPSTRSSAFPGSLPTYTVPQFASAGAQRCAQGACSVTTLPLPQDSQRVAPAAASLHVIARGARLEITRRDDWSALGVVVAGSGTIASVAPRSAPPAAIERWTAFRAHSGSIALTALADQDLAVAIVLVGRPAHRVTAGPAYLLRSIAAEPDLAWAGGAFRACIAFDASSSPEASLELLMGAPDAPVPEHNHPMSWEVLLPLQADGQLGVPAQFMSGSPGWTVEPFTATVRAGLAQHVAIAVRHSWTPNGTVPLIAVQSYVPLGPEQRFRALASSAAT